MVEAQGLLNEKTIGQADGKESKTKTSHHQHNNVPNFDAIFSTALSSSINPSHHDGVDNETRKKTDETSKVPPSSVSTSSQTTRQATIKGTTIKGTTIKVEKSTKALGEAQSPKHNELSIFSVSTTQPSDVSPATNEKSAVQSIHSDSDQHQSSINYTVPLNTQSALVTSSGSVVDHIQNALLQRATTASAVSSHLDMPRPALNLNEDASNPVSDTITSTNKKQSTETSPPAQVHSPDAKITTSTSNSWDENGSDGDGSQNTAQSTHNSKMASSNTLDDTSYSVVQNASVIASQTKVQAPTVPQTLSIASPNSHDVFKDIVRGQVQSNQNSVSVQIHPDGMGNIKITVNQDANQHLSVEVEASNEQTLKWFQQEKNALTQSLQSNGFEISNMQFSYDHGDAQQNSHSFLAQQNKQSVSISSPMPVDESLDESELELASNSNIRRWFG